MWQPLSSTENPLRWSYPLSSMAGLQAQVKAVVSHVKGCIRSVTNLTLSSSISRLACFPDSTMPFTDCIVLWSGGCRHELTTHVLEPLSDLVLDFSSLVTNQPSWHARQSVSDRDPERDGRWERGLRTPQRHALKCVVSTGSQVAKSQVRDHQHTVEGCVQRHSGHPVCANGPFTGDKFHVLSVHGCSYEPLVVRGLFFGFWASSPLLRVRVLFDSGTPERWSRSPPVPAHWALCTRLYTDCLPLWTPVGWLVGVDVAVV